jgi:GMP synthase (glutamine-hydrolysing)
VPDESDPLIGKLAPKTTVLHWHGECFDLPHGADALASSRLTECQAFRYGSAWGLLFHPEADRRLVERWLGVPAMAEEAKAALGPDYAATLKNAATTHERTLVERSTPGFENFAARVVCRASILEERKIP